jgi:hypothetical protein
MLSPAALYPHDIREQERREKELITQSCKKNSEKELSHVKRTQKKNSVTQ